MKKLRFMVVEKRESLVRNEGDEDKRIKEQRYDPASFEGRVTLSPILDGGPSYFEEVEFRVNDWEAYKALERGKVYIMSWEEETVA